MLNIKLSEIAKLFDKKLSYEAIINTVVTDSRKAEKAACLSA